MQRAVSVQGGEVADYPRWLLDLTNTRLGQLVTQKYEAIGAGSGLRLRMGTTFWDGPAGTTLQESRNNVALLAYRELMCLPPSAMRAMLGVKAPEEIHEIQAIRAAMNKLRSRMFRRFTGVPRQIVLDRWSFVLQNVESMEHMLRIFEITASNP